MVGMRKLVRLLNKFNDYLINIGTSIGVIILILVTLMIAAGVFTRWAGGVLGFVEEYTGYALVFMVYMTLAYSVKRGDHISIDIVANLLPEKTQRMLENIVLFLSLGTVGILIRYALWLWIKSIMYGWKSLTMYPTDLWIPQTFMVLGLIIFFITILLVLVHRFIDLREELG